jgi:transcriptional regulator with XRE-family HTH domain
VATNQAKPPTVRLRRLAAALRRLRADSGLTREEVEEQTGVNPGTLYRLESARSRPQKRTLIALLNLYEVTGDLRADLLDLSKNADGQGWLRPYHAELPEEYAAYISFESEARATRNYESLYIPGLLQTEDYARSAIHGTLPTATGEEVENRVRARMERQERLAGESPVELWAIADEAAIRRQVGGPKVMRAQLEHLLAAARQPNITVQVIPYDVGAHPGMPGSFIYMEFTDPADPDLVYVDTLAGDLFLESDDDLRLYASMFDHLRAIALSPAKTKGLITDITESLKEKQLWTSSPGSPAAIHPATAPASSARAPRTAAWPSATASTPLAPPSPSPAPPGASSRKPPVGPDPQMGAVRPRGPDDARRLWRAGRLAEAAQLVDEFGPFNIGVDGDPDFSLEAAILEAWGDQIMASNPAEGRAVYLRAAGAQHAHAAGATAGGEGLARVAVAERIRAKAIIESLLARQWGHLPPHQS